MHTPYYIVTNTNPCPCTMHWYHSHVGLSAGWRSWSKSYDDNDDDLTAEVISGTQGILSETASLCADHRRRQQLCADKFID